MNVRTRIAGLIAFSMCCLAAEPAFSQIVDVSQCEVPGSVTDRAQRAILNSERSGLLHEMNGLVRTGQIHGQECASFEIGSDQEARCKTLSAEWKADVDHYSRRARKFCNNLNSIGRSLRSDTNASTRKTELVLDALQSHPNDWQGSLDYLVKLRRLSPDDPVIQQAFAYVNGMYRGYIAARDLSERNYENGVREWLNGNYSGAARFFAQALRADPSDLKLLRSFAHTVGRQHGSIECERGRRCVSDSLPEWVSYFGPAHVELIKELERTAEQPGNPPQLHQALNYLRGLSVYATAHPPHSRPSSTTAQALVNSAIRKSTRGDYLGAARSYAAAVLESGGDRELVYLRHYFEGAAIAHGQEGELPDNLAAAELFSGDLLMDVLDLREWRRRSRIKSQESMAPADPGILKEFAVKAWQNMYDAFRHAGRNIPYFSNPDSGAG